MRIRLENFDDKGCYRKREWHPAPFFDGTICRENDLKKVRSITAQKEARMSKPQQRIVEHCEYSEDMDEYEATLSDGQVRVRMAFGCYLGMAGEKGEFLDLEGDAGLIWNLLPLIVLGTACGKCERPRTMAEVRQLPEGRCLQCSQVSEK